MVGYTDPPFRALISILSPHTQLFTEMVPVNSVIYGGRQDCFSHFPGESNVALQLAGNDPDGAAKVAHMAEKNGFDEINLNCGCPSSRVQSGRFGGCLMYQPKQVAQIVSAIKQRVSIPVTVKHRTGVESNLNYLLLQDFVGSLENVGCDGIIVHARNVFLEGLSPKQNRTIPPIRAHVVRQLKQDFPNMDVCYNGEISTIEQFMEKKQNAGDPKIDAIMLGRAAWNSPYLFALLEQRLFMKESPLPDRFTAVDQYLKLIDEYRSESKTLKSSVLVKPLMNLFSGCAGSKRWREKITSYGGCLSEWHQIKEELLSLSIAIEKPV